MHPIITEQPNKKCKSEKDVHKNNRKMNEVGYTTNKYLHGTPWLVQLIYFI